MSWLSSETPIPVHRMAIRARLYYTTPRVHKASLASRYTLYRSRTPSSTMADVNTMVTFCKGISNYLGSADLSDFTITCCGHKWPVHRFCLSLYSSVLAKACNGDFKVRALIPQRCAVFQANEIIGGPTDGVRLLGVSGGKHRRARQVSVQFRLRCVGRGA